MSFQSPERERRCSHLSICTHTRVLGVDIACFPQATAALMDGNRYIGGLDAEPEIHAWQGEPWDKGCRRDLAAWARRSLFDGAGSGGSG